MTTLPGDIPEAAELERNRINLRWLVRLRWGAVAGQLVTVIAASRGLDLPLPLGTLLSLIALNAAANLGAALWLGRSARVPEEALAGLMGLDVLVLTGLLAASGGPSNPFSTIYLVNIALAAVVLRPAWTWGLACFSLACFAVLFAAPLGTEIEAAMGHGAHGADHGLHLEGMWVAFGVSAAFIVYFVQRVTGELGRRDRELADVRAARARAEQLASLATLAAGAAHELATPLSTIAVVARELERTLGAERRERIDTFESRAARDDARLIREQVDRCREILDHMAGEAGETPGEPFVDLTLAELLLQSTDELAAAGRVDVAVDPALRDEVLKLPRRAVAQAVRALAKNAVEATADGSRVAVEEEPEGPAGAPSCFDLVDNDCDGLTDHADPPCQSEELCNGFDDDADLAVDEDFAELGAPCTVGTGFCARSGTLVCAGSGLGTTCSVSPGLPLAEAAPGSASCTDGADNDCDGLVDVADPACQEAERCDGLDNDGDGDVDEGFDLGAACSVGAGACEALGENACLPDGSGAICSASPSAPSAEGPAGATCADGVDNDCDGSTDLEDPSCGAAELAATCALPIARGERGASCGGTHEIRFAALHASGEAVVTAELLGLDAAGNVLQAIPVQNGDLAHLVSGLGKVKLSSQRNRHQVLAPIPMLRVRVADGGREVEAYCSNLPFLDIVAPSGLLGTVAVQGEATSARVAIPRVDAKTLTVELDDVDLLAALGVDPATDLPGGPFAGTVMIGGDTIEVSDLVVESGGLAELSSNTLRMQIAGLAGGGHLLEVDGDAQAGALPAPGSVHCLEDDLQASLTIESFEVVVHSPLPGEVVATVPTPVTGEVRHGRAIAGLSVNGLALDVSGQTFEPGVGPAGTFVLPFATALAQTDFLADVTGLSTSVATFDPGANRLVVEARDDRDNRAFASHVFAVGDVLPLPSFAATTRSAAGPLDLGTIALHEGTEVADALVVGLVPDAVRRIFERYCSDGEDDFEELLAPAINDFLSDPGELDALPQEADLSGVCNPPLEYELLEAGFKDGDPMVCGAEFGDGTLTIPVTLPDILFTLHITGGCSTFAWHSVKVDRLQPVQIRDPGGFFTLTETDLLMDQLMPEITFNLSEDQIELLPATDNSSAGGFLLDLLTGFWDALNVVSFGLLDFVVGLVVDLYDAIAGLFDSESAPGTFSFAFPIELDGFGLARDLIVSEMLGFEASLQAVKIDPAGLTASLEASFMPTMLDPDIPEIPGVAQTAADPPMPPIDMADGFFSISDDAVNAILASLTAQGEFKSICSSPTPVADFLPDECCSLKGDECCTMGGTACDGLEVPVCEALKAPSCDVLTDPLALFLCIGLESKNITGETSVLLCGRQEIPPVLLVRDDFDVDGNPIATPDRIETHVRLNDTRVFAILDRDADETASAFGTLPSCLDPAASVSTDCRVLETCLDLNVINSLALDTTDDPALVVEIGAIQNLPRDPGILCEGELPFLFIPDVIDRALESEALMDLTLRIELNTPVLQPEGFDLLGIGRLASPRLVGIRTTEATPGFDDYLGLLGAFELPP